MDAPTWHDGEIALQQRAGSAARLAEIGPAIIRDHMPQQHRDFFGQLPFIVAGTVDADGQPWASVLAGPPGFVSSPDAVTLQVQAALALHDALATNLAPGAAIGLLGIEPHTRRRNRMNGVVRGVHGSGFSVTVGQSFGNCPKYIQARRPEYLGPWPFQPVVHRTFGLDAAAKRLIAQADTFFIATAHPAAADGARPPAFGVDVSHRGGRPGFVRTQGDVLTVPDFIGNMFFNTLGNLVLNPRCSLLFIDYTNGDVLSLAARGEIVFEGTELESFEGAQRLLRLQVVSAQRVEAALPLRWSDAELSSNLQRTGDWK